MNLPFAPPTPVSPPVLLGEVRRLRSLLDELAPLLELGLPPSLDALRSDVQLALERPETLNSAQNQLDFIEEFAEAVWGEPPAVLTRAGEDATSGARRRLRRHRVSESWDELDRRSERLCQDAEAWHRRRTVTAASPTSGRLQSSA